MKSKSDEHLGQVIANSEKAFQYRLSDPETALFYARKAVETICRDVYESELGSSSDGVTLGNMIGEIGKKAVVPKGIYYSLRVIQSFGGTNAHEDAAQYTQPALGFLPVIVCWYFETYREIPIPSHVEMRQKEILTEQGKLDVQHTTVNKEEGQSRTNVNDSSRVMREPRGISGTKTSKEISEESIRIPIKVIKRRPSSYSVPLSPTIIEQRQRSNNSYDPFKEIRILQESVDSSCKCNKW